MKIDAYRDGELVETIEVDVTARLTWQDFIDARAPMDLAPAPGWDYVLIGNKWSQVIPGCPLDEVSPLKFITCMSVAQKLNKLAEKT